VKRIVTTVVVACILLASGNSALAQDSRLKFSFDQVDVQTFVKLVGEITGKRFVLDEGVKGKITVVSPEITPEEVFPIFVSILESVGCSVVSESGDVYQVIRMSARKMPSAPVVLPNEQIPEQGVVTKVIRLQYVTASEMKDVLEAHVRGGKEGAIGAIDATNHLIITDTSENIRRIERIIGEVDKPGTSRGTEVVALKFAKAEDLADELTRAMSANSESRGVPRQTRQLMRSVGGSAQESGKTVTIVASPHSNGLILVGSVSQLEELKRIISLMDVEAPSGRGRLSAIFLQYISAEEAAKSLNALLQGQRDPKNPNVLTEQPIRLEPHVSNNALLVDATPRDFQLIEELIKDLDQAPEQVLIEVLIAEVMVRDDMEIGVDFAVLEFPKEVGSTVAQGTFSVRDDPSRLMNAIQTGLFPRGLSIGLAHGVSEDSDGNIVSGYPGMINIDALKKDGRFDVLSQIPLLAQNNKEASVSVVHNVPLLKSTISAGAGTARDIIQNIDRVDVGIKLKLTPHINPRGEVRMELNPSIEAIIDSGPTGDALAPTIAKREVSTTVTVPDGQTVVLSGLMREDQTENIRKIPVLGSLPLIGWLFRHTITAKEKTNLIIFVTPHIVTDYAEAERVTEAWREKTRIVGTNSASLSRIGDDGTDK
jgi:general secretion pathway protein D